MNPRTFLQQFEESTDRDRMVDLVYDEMAAYCRQHGVSTDDISNEELEQLADAFVKRGFAVPPSDETATERNKWNANRNS